VAVEDVACVTAAEAQGEIQGGKATCLSGWDLSRYDYISVSGDGLIPISVKPTSMTRLSQLGD
jgi:hypothetical protein